MRRSNRCTRNKVPARYLDAAEEKKVIKGSTQKSIQPKVPKPVKVKKDPAMKQQVKKYNSIVSNEAAEILLDISANHEVQDSFSSAPNAALSDVFTHANHQLITEVRAINLFFG